MSLKEALAQGRAKGLLMFDTCGNFWLTLCGFPVLYTFLGLFETKLRLKRYFEIEVEISF